MRVAACCLLIAAALLAAADKGAARAAGGSAAPAPVEQERTGRVLVRLKPGGVATDALAPAKVGNAAVVDEVGELGIVVLRPSAGDVYGLLELLERNPDVEFAEAELVRRAYAEPNDPALRLQWGHRAIRSAQGGI